MTQRNNRTSVDMLHHEKLEYRYTNQCSLCISNPIQSTMKNSLSCPNHVYPPPHSMSTMVLSVFGQLGVLHCHVGARTWSHPIQPVSKCLRKISCPTCLQKMCWWLTVVHLVSTFMVHYIWQSTFDTNKNVKRWWMSICAGTQLLSRKQCKSIVSLRSLIYCLLIKLGVRTLLDEKAYMSILVSGSLNALC